MADEFNCLCSEIQNYIAEADADLIPVQGQLELHSRCRCGVLLSPCFGALLVADLILRMEESEWHYRCRGRCNFRKTTIATIAVRMVKGASRNGPRQKMPRIIRKRAEYGFGEHGLKHRAQWVFWPSPSSGERAQWAPLSLLFVCQSELSKSFAELTDNSVSSLFRNSALERVFRAFPKNIKLSKTIFDSFCAVPIFRPLLGGSDVGWENPHTIDTEIKAKRKNIISELITFGIAKAKAKVKFGVMYLCNHECERSSVQLISIRKRKRRNIFRELISL